MKSFAFTLSTALVVILAALSTAAPQRGEWFNVESSNATISRNLQRSLIRRQSGEIPEHCFHNQFRTRGDFVVVDSPRLLVADDSVRETILNAAGSFYLCVVSIRIFPTDTQVNLALEIHDTEDNAPINETTLLSRSAIM